MRLFVAFDIPYEVRRNLELLLAHLKPKADIAWSPPSNLHITTKFIGEWPEQRLAEVERALQELPVPPPFTIAVQGLGWFPGVNSPRVFWAGISAPPELAGLALNTDRALERVGVPRETKPFAPHLTLARIRRPAALEPLRKAIEELPSADFGAWRATQFHLYESRLRPGGSVYTKLRTFPLGSE